MLKKNNIYIAIIITLFFLVIAYFTTFRIAIYSFVVCYIGVIIAKSKNKRLRVPVPDFFILTFFVGIIFALFYSYSPRIQYYEFVMMHSRWEVVQVDKIEEKSSTPIVFGNDFQIGTSVSTDLFFKQDSALIKKIVDFNYLDGSLLNIINQDDNSERFAVSEIDTMKSNLDLYIFKKPNKEVYKVFSKNDYFRNSHSAANLAFSIFFFIVFLFSILKLVFRPKKNISVILNQYPKRDFYISISSILYILVYSIYTFLF